MTEISINHPDEKWKTRRKSWLMKCLMMLGKIDNSRLANCLGTNTNYLNNKFSRDSFSFEDILIAAEASGKCIAIIDKKNFLDMRMIRFTDWFSEIDPEVIQRTVNLEEEKRMYAQTLYLRMKREIEEIKEKYGFEEDCQCV